MMNATSTSSSKDEMKREVEEPYKTVEEGMTSDTTEEEVNMTDMEATKTQGKELPLKNQDKV